MVKNKNFKIKSENGKVEALFKAGNDFVLTRLDLEGANSIIEKGKIVKSDRADFPICVDNKWYFKKEEQPKKTVRKEKSKNG